jgi:acyl-coenzyme A thioesterase PaaI-like protein
LVQTLTGAVRACKSHCQIGVTATRTDNAVPRQQHDVAVRVRDAWRRLRRLPGGRWVFSRLIGTLIPYTGTVRPLVLELEPGFARIAMRDRRRVRNHLGSVHAIALANLAEMTSGLALTVGLPDAVRGIVRRITIEYEKKARGTLIAECRCDLPPIVGRMEFPVTAVVRDASGSTVATATVLWLLEARSAPPTPQT